MPAKTHGDRLDRLEQIVEILAERQLSLEHTVAELATETRRGFDQAAAEIRETQAMIRELAKDTDERFRRTNDRIDRLAAEDRERAKALDDRVDKLVIAIADFIRAQHPPR